ncbi:hypothetical protein H2248_006730 [Termitomyces sp. 'cryptogamus']|nr:hypothetical protein H2248_006730 [Termitomyces sp. 'cryptogamus']
MVSDLLGVSTINRLEEYKRQPDWAGEYQDTNHQHPLPLLFKEIPTTSCSLPAQPPLANLTAALRLAIVALAVLASMTNANAEHGPL